MQTELNYIYFSVEDFVWDTAFRQWALNPDTDSDGFWNKWIDAHPQKKEIILTAKQLVKSVQVKNVFISDNEVEFAIQSVLNQLKIPQPIVDKKKYFFNVKQLFAAASILLAACLIVWFVFSISKSGTGSLYNNLVNSSDEKLIERVNTTGKPMTVNLGDGSKVSLGNNARISFPVSFSNLHKRKIYLTGEAFFEVAKDPSKPFLVYANGLITKVLGTKFKIRAYPNEHISTVEVSSGIVSVFSFINKTGQDEDKSKKLNSLVLTRNQKANYSGHDRSITAAIVDNPQMINDNKIKYSFSETPLTDVFNLIEQGYGIDIIYDNKSFLNRTFSANLESTTFFQKLDIICKTIGSRYEVIDGKIVIYGK